LGGAEKERLEVAIHELTEEQVRSWTLEQKDRWWLENVFRGNMPQLTIRSALTGMILGALLSLTNLYVGAKTGWTLGVGITSVILAFGMFKFMQKLNLAKEFTVLENNAMQSIATAAGYMTSPMISSLAAYMMVTKQIIPMWQTMIWIIVLAILGVLFAFPFKRRFINDEQQPFPEGRAAGVVMDALHHGQAAAGLLKAKLLLLFAGLAAFVKFFQNEAIMKALRVPFHIPEFLDTWLYRHTGTPKIMGTPLTSLTIRPEVELPMLGAGGLMGIRTGASLLIGAIINYAILAPVFIEQGDIVPTVRKTTDGVQTILGFREITFWSLWCGAAMMTVASLLAFFAKPQVLVSSFKNMFGGKQQGTDVLGHIELPLKVSIFGIPILSVLILWMGYEFFEVHPAYSALAIAVTFIFALIAINSTALTSITPIGAMGKLTQLTFGAVAPGNKQVNLMTAGITGEVASNSANLLMDIKPGYMLGAKPRQQAIGHVLGVFAGAILSVPIFYMVFLRDHENKPIPPSEVFSTAAPAAQDVGFGEHPMPSATVWKGVADVLGEGIGNIPVSARWAALVGILAAIVLEFLRIRTKNRFPLSPIGIGLAFVIPFYTCFVMFLGSFIFWLAERLSRNPKESLLVENQEPICAGLIAGGSLMGVAVAIIEVFFL